MMRMPNALLAAILAILASFGTADATTIYYDEVAFIADSGPLDLESFEGLAAGNESVAFSRTLPDFTISATSLAAVNDIATADGQHATDGTHYIIQTEAGTRMAFTVTFASPIREFGLTITDYGDVPGSAGGEPLTFATNTGIVGAAAFGNQPDGTNQFFGLIDASNPFTTITLLAPDIIGFVGPFSVDQVRFTAVPTSTDPVPEPTSLVLLATGLVGIVRAARSRKQHQ